jgi:hypothetical protein
MTTRAELPERHRKAVQKLIVETLASKGTEMEAAAALGISQQSVNNSKNYAKAGYRVLNSILRALKLDEATFLARYAPPETEVSFESPHVHSPELEAALSDGAYGPETVALARYWLARTRHTLTVDGWSDFLDGLEREVRRATRMAGRSAVSPARSEPCGWRGHRGVNRTTRRSHWTLPRTCGLRVRPKRVHGRLRAGRSARGPLPVIRYLWGTGLQSVGVCG